MVSGGEWKDYGLNISKTEVSFNVYKRASEFPVYRIAKKLNPKYKNGTYIIKDSLGNVLKSSEKIQKYLGINGINILRKVFGIILLAIGFILLAISLTLIFLIKQWWQENFILI